MSAVLMFYILISFDVRKQGQEAVGSIPVDSCEFIDALTADGPPTAINLRIPGLRQPDIDGSKSAKPLRPGASSAAHQYKFSHSEVSPLAVLGLLLSFAGPAYAQD